VLDSLDEFKESRSKTGEKPLAKRIFTYRIDFIPVAMVAGILLAQSSAVIWHWPWYSVALILLLIRHVSLVEHNHAHLSIFRLNALNEVFGWFCFLSNGIPLEFYRIHHVKNHHRYNQRFNKLEKDWSSTFGFRGTRFPDVPISKTYYVLTFPIITISSSLIYLLRSPGSKHLKRFIASVLVITFSGIALCLVNRSGFVLFFLVPWLAVIFGHGFNNYDQHKGCSMADRYNSANESLSFFGRVIWFNIGYHVEHHIRPSLHWSKLPDLHHQILQFIPPERLTGEAGYCRKANTGPAVTEGINR
jgi:beta-carotene hydroxylase